MLQETTGLQLVANTALALGPSPLTAVPCVPSCQCLRVSRPSPHIGCPNARPVKGHAPDPENAQPFAHGIGEKASWVISAALVQQTGGNSHQAPRKSRVVLTPTFIGIAIFCPHAGNFTSIGSGIPRAKRRGSQQVKPCEARFSAPSKGWHRTRSITGRGASTSATRPAKGCPSLPTRKHCTRQKVKT